MIDVIDEVSEAEDRLVQLGRSSGVPAQPDRQWVDAWLHRSHLDFWERSGRVR